MTTDRQIKALAQSPDPQDRDRARRLEYPNSVKTWATWVSECRAFAASNRGVEYPAEFVSSGQSTREQWRRFWLDGFAPRIAMERMNRRRMQ